MSYTIFDRMMLCIVFGHLLGRMLHDWFLLRIEMAKTKGK